MAVKKVRKMKKRPPKAAARAAVPERRLELVYEPVENLKEWAKNPRRNDAAAEKLASVMSEHGFINPIIATRDGIIRAGHTRLKSALKLGIAEVPVIYVDFKTEAEAEMFALADNKSNEWAEWDEGMLANLFDQRQKLGAGQLEALSGFARTEIEGLGAAAMAPEVLKGNLQERFGVPPFTVLDGRQGYWKERKAAWLALGIQSELGRGSDISGDGMGLISHHKERKGFGGDYDISKGEGLWGGVGTSVFDPVLCELIYRWFCPPGGSVLDPFAGGSVRGIVAAVLGLQYTGIDLSAAQLASNRKQWKDMAKAWPKATAPNWVEGDGLDARELSPGLADLVFTCPPYADLEVYSDDPRDISTMSYERFLDVHARILTAAARTLAPGGFLCWVVGNVRDRQELLRDLVGATVAAGTSAGLGLYNDAILLTPIGSLPMRAGRHFSIRRKLGRTHQNVLVFYKGDPHMIEGLDDSTFGELPTVPSVRKVHKVRKGTKP